MHLVTFRNALSLSFQKSAGQVTITCEPGKPYAFADSHMDQVMRDEKVASAAVKISNLGSRIPNFHIGARRVGTQRLLFYNGSGGYGDQIMSWPVCQILHAAGFEVHVLVDPGNQSCWWGFPWVKSVHVLPFAYDTMVMFDYFVFFDHVANLDEHPGQEHPVDIMLRKIGIDPVSVDRVAKRVRPVFTPADLTAAERLKGQDYAIYQLASANPTRSLPPKDSVFLLDKLSSEFRGLKWIVAADAYVAPGYTEALAPLLQRDNVEAWNDDNLRALWAVTENAKVVVGPDSMMVHVAGSLSVPCVGLWGLTSPDSRARYYDNHYPIWHQTACPMAPCFTYGINFPVYCPPRPARDLCEVMAAISPQHVIDHVRNIVYKNEANDKADRETHVGSSRSVRADGADGTD